MKITDKNMLVTDFIKVSDLIEYLEPYKDRDISVGEDCGLDFSTCLEILISDYNGSVTFYVMNYSEIAGYIYNDEDEDPKEYGRYSEYCNEDALCEAHKKKLEDD